MSTLVAVGTAKKSFKRIIDLVMSEYEIFPKPIIFQHGHTEYDFKDQISFSFIGMDDFEETISQMEMVITHAGIGVPELCIKYGVPVVIVPRLKKNDEHVNDHQIDTGKYYDSIYEGCCEFVTDDNLFFKAVEKIKLGYGCSKVDRNKDNRNKFEKFIEVIDMLSKKHDHRII